MGLDLWIAKPHNLYQQLIKFATSKCHWFPTLYGKKYLWESVINTSVYLMCGVQRSGAANIGSWSTPSPPDVTGINGSKTVRLGAHTSLHMGAAVHNSPFIIYTSASPTENYTFANDVFWTSLEMTNSQVSGSAMVEEPATFLTLSGRKLPVTFLIFTKLLLQFFLAALLAALLTYIGDSLLISAFHGHLPE